MNALTAAALVATINAAVLAGINGYIAERIGSDAVRTWYYSWVCYTGRLVINIAITVFGSSALLVFLTHFLAASSGYLLLRGAFIFTGRRAPTVWLLLGILGVGWTGVALLLQLPFFLMALPTFSYLGVGTIAAGIVLLHPSKKTVPGNRLAAYSLVLWGIHKFNFPFLRPMEQFAPYGYVIGAILAIVVGAALLVSVVEGSRIALTESESRFQSVVEAMDDIVFTLDPHGRRTGVYGRTAAEILGEEGGSAHRKPLDQVLSGQMAVYESQLPTNGGTRHVQTTLSPILGADGSVIGAVGVGRDITDLKLTQAKLQAGIAERETLLREIHHRVKNNLQVVSSLIHLQTNKVRDAESTKLFEATAARVVAMAMVHEQLYESENLSQVDLGRYVDRLVGFIASSYEREGLTITQEVETTSVHVEIDRAVPCAMILNELVSNSFRHAFPGDRTGHIHVSLKTETSDRPDESTICITVKDDGVGSQAGRGQGLGTVLVRELAAQLRATVDRLEQDGTTVRVCFGVPTKR